MRDRSGVLPIQVVLATDENYAQHVGVTVASLLANRSSRQALTITILADGLSDSSRQALLEIAASRNADLRFVSMTGEEQFTGLFTHTYITRPTYFRLALPRLLPETVKRAIYLDCDLIIRKDISGLWEAELEGQPVGAVTDPEILLRPAYLGFRKRLMLPEHSSYFNSGVLLMDLEIWRSEGIADQVLAFAKDQAARLVCCDQDSLNATLHSRWKALDPKWNVQTTSFSIARKWGRRHLVDKPLFEAVRDPAIVHFTGPIKPWHAGCTVPFSREYLRFLEQTPWKGAPLTVTAESPSPRKRIEQRLRRQVKDALFAVIHRWRLRKSS